MNPSKRGLSTGTKTAVVVVAIIVVVSVVYFVPGIPLGGGASHSGCQTTKQTGAVSTVGGNQTAAVYSLVKAFCEMQLAVDIYAPDQEASNNTYSYSVLGTSTLTITSSVVKNNSTSTTTVTEQCTRVEFLTVGTGNDVIMWFNATGYVPRVDVLGQRNYTGNGVPQLPYVTTYTNLFGVIPEITGNATLFHMLTKYGETTTGIGPTQADVTTYTLPSPTVAYSALTVKVATVPANNVELAVYLYARAHDTSYTLIQVTSMKT